MAMSENYELPSIWFSNPNKSFHDRITLYPAAPFQLATLLYAWTIAREGRGSSQGRQTGKANSARLAHSHTSCPPDAPPGKKQPFHVARPDGKAFAFAGLWDYWMSADGSELKSAAIITTAANDTLKPIYHRMPVVINPEDFAIRLDTDETASSNVLRLMAPADIHSPPQPDEAPSDQLKLF